jgi:calcineurin-like phosphoesterase family protein
MHPPLVSQTWPVREKAEPVVQVPLPPIYSGLSSKGQGKSIGRTDRRHQEAMTEYFTADQHFGHKNIIEYSGRPFHGVNEMNAVMVANWNAVVEPQDTVHVLGDIAMGRREESMPLIGLLAGHKILYPGNHDRCWHGHGDHGLRLQQDYLDAGFEAIRQGAVSVIIGGRELLACHLPYRGDSQTTERFSKFRPADRGMWLLHGHVHERWLHRERMINVGVDVWNFTPVSGETILKLIDGLEAEASVGGRQAQVTP